MNISLGDVAEFIRGITYKPEDVLEEDIDGSLVCMRTANVQAELDETSLIRIRADLARDPKKYLQEGDILVSVANSWNLVGKCCWTPKLSYRATFGGFVAVLRADRARIDPRYLYHWYSSARIQAAARACSRQTTNISNMDLGRALSIEMFLPNVGEQHRIVSLLDQVVDQRKRHIEASGSLGEILDVLHEQELFPDHRSS